MPVWMVVQPELVGSSLAVNDAESSVKGELSVVLLQHEKGRLHALDVFNCYLFHFFQVVVQLDDWLFHRCLYAEHVRLMLYTMALSVLFDLVFHLRRVFL